MRRTLTALVLAALTGLGLCAEPARLEIVRNRSFDRETCAAASAEPLRAPLIAGAPAIDGALDDAFWRTAFHAKGFCTRAGAPATAPTEMWIAHNGDTLFLAARCRRAAADANWAKGEQFTFFVDGNNDGDDCFRVSLRPNGKAQIGFEPAGSAAVRRLRATWQTAARLDELGGEWALEAAAPLAQLEAFSGATIRLNAERSGVSGVPIHQRETFWAATLGRGVKAERFPRLVLAGAPIEVEMLHAGEMLRGPNVLTLRLRNAADKPIALCASASAADAGGRPGRRVDVVVAAGETATVRAPYEIVRSGPVCVRYEVTAQQPAVRIGSVVEGVAPEGSFFAVLREKLLPKVADAQDGRVLAEGDSLLAYVRLDRSSAGLKDASLRAAIRRADSEAVLREGVVGPLESRAFVFRCDVSGLPHGEYRLSAALVQPGRADLPLGAEPFSLLERAPAPAEKTAVPLLVDNEVAGLQGPHVHETGLLLPPGALYSASNIRVVDAAGRPLATQARVVNRWRQDGDIKLAQVLFEAPEAPAAVKMMDALAGGDAEAAAPFRLEFGTRVAGAAVARPLQVRETAEAISVDTGAIRAVVNRRDGFLAELALDINGNGAYEAEESVLDADAPRALSAVDQNGTLYIGCAQAADDAAVLEQAGPLRAVVRLKGFYVDGNGRRGGAYMVRLHFTRGQSAVRIDHTWIMSEDANALQLADLSIAIPLRGLGQRRSVTFDTPFADQRTWTETLGERGRAFMLQDLYNHHGQVGARAGIYSARDAASAYELRKSFDRTGHWMEVSGERYGVTLAIRDMWQQFPKELEVDGGVIRAHLWSGRTIEQEQPAKFGLRLMDFRNEALIAWYGDRFIRGVKMDGKPDWAYMWQNAHGIARTHELLLRFHVSETPSASAARAGEFQTPVLTLPDPRWSCSALPLEQLHPYAPGRFPEMEAVLDKFAAGQLWEDDRIGNYGFNEYGSSPHFLVENVSRPGQEPFTREDRLQASMYRYAGHVYSLDTYLWWNYVRSGDRRYYELARRHVLHLLDRQIGHVNDAMGRYGKYCDYASPYFWADGALGQWSFYTDCGMWLSAFGGLRWGEDAAEHVAAAYERRSRNRDWLDGVPLHQGSPLRPWYGMLHEACASYSYFWNLDHLCMAAELAARLINPESLSGVMPGAGESAGRPEHTNVMLRPMIRYWLATQKESARAAVSKICENYYQASFDMHGYTMNLAPYVWATDYFVNRRPEVLAIGLEDVKAPFGRAWLGIPGFVEMDYWRSMGPNWKGYTATLPFLMAALAREPHVGRYPRLQVEAAYDDCSVYFDDPDDEPFRAEMSFAVTTYPLMPALQAGESADTVPLRLTGPSGKPVAGARWLIEPMAYMGVKTVYVLLDVPKDGEKGTYTLTVGKQACQARVRFAVRNTTARKMVLGISPRVQIGTGPLYFHVPKGAQTVRLGGVPAQNVRDSQGRGVENARKGIAVPAGCDGSLWSLVTARAVDAENVPRFVAFYEPAQFFIPDVRTGEEAAADESGLLKQTFAAGKFGQGLQINNRDVFCLIFSGKTQTAAAPAGTVEFWYRPNVPHAQGDQLFRAFRGDEAVIGLYARNEKVVLEGKRAERGFPLFPYYSTEHFLAPGAWHHVAVCWDMKEQRVAIYVDGVGNCIEKDRVTRQWTARDFAGLFDRLYLLSTPEGRAGGATLDEVRVSTCVRYPGGFVPPSAPFAIDKDTAALVRLDGDLECAGGVPGVTVRAEFTDRDR